MGKKLTWAIISGMVSIECGVDPATVEKVLRSFGKLTGPELDEDCDLINQFHNLNEGKNEKS